MFWPPQYRWFDSTAQHDNQDRAVQHVIHAPAGAKELAHFKHAITDRLDIAQNAALHLVQAHPQADACRTVAQPIKPFVKFGEPFDGEHGWIVITCSRNDKRFMTHISVGVMQSFLNGAQSSVPSNSHPSRQ